MDLITTSLGMMFAALSHGAYVSGVIGLCFVPIIAAILALGSKLIYEVVKNSQTRYLEGAEITKVIIILVLSVLSFGLCAGMYYDLTSVCAPDYRAIEKILKVMQ